jgi:hypothetical protein
MHAKVGHLFCLRGMWTYNYCCYINVPCLRATYSRYKLCAHYNRRSHSFITVSNLQTNIATFLSHPFGNPKTFFLSPPSDILRHFSSLPLRRAKISSVGGGVWIFSGTTQLFNLYAHIFGNWSVSFAHFANFPVWDRFYLKIGQMRLKNQVDST